MELYYANNQNVEIKFDDRPDIVLKGTLINTVGKHFEIEVHFVDENALAHIKENAHVTINWENEGQFYSYPCDLVAADKNSFKLKLAGLERREFQRVDSFLMMKYQVFDPKEIEMAKYYVMENEQEFISKSIKDLEKEIVNTEDSEKWLLLLQHVNNMNKDFNKKLDSIIDMIHEDEAKKSGMKKCPILNISGSGFSFLDDIELKKNDLIKVCVYSGEFESSSLKCLAKVVRNKGRTQRKGFSDKEYYEYSSHIYFIKEDDRERIIKYVFKRQREIIREAKEKLI